MITNLKSALDEPESIQATWSRGNINTSGNNASSTSYVRTDYISYPVGTYLEFTGALLAGTETINRVSFCYCYTVNKTYIERVQLIKGTLEELPITTRYIRITYGYPSSAHMDIEDEVDFARYWQGYFLTGVWKTINYIKDNQAVTPQMFGAIADGVQDDTAAFQAALNSGYNVFVPTNHHEIYRITATLTVPNTCKAIYGTGQWRTATTYGGYITFDLTPLHDAGNTINGLRAYPLFDLDTSTAVTIQGLKFTCPSVYVATQNYSRRVGYFLSGMNTSRVDYDFRMENVQIGGFYRGIRLLGRGCEIYNCHIGTCNYFLTLSWDHDTNQNHPEGTGQRGISIKNNRFHSIGTRFIRVISGHVYGFTFSENTIDNGKGCLVDCESDEAWNWIIENNLFQGIETKNPVIKFRGGIKNSIINNNIFSADLGYWYNRTESPPTFVRVVGSMKNTNIQNNVFVNSSSSCFYLEDVENSIISGNNINSPCLDNIETEYEYDDETGEIIEIPPEIPYKTSSIYIEGQLKNSIISNNVVTTTQTGITLIEFEEEQQSEDYIINSNIPNI